jgi:hypothetical protein
LAKRLGSICFYLFLFTCMTKCVDQRKEISDHVQRVESVAGNRRLARSIPPLSHIQFPLLTFIQSILTHKLIFLLYIYPANSLLRSFTCSLSTSQLCLPQRLSERLATAPRSGAGPVPTHGFRIPLESFGDVKNRHGFAGDPQSMIRVRSRDALQAMRSRLQ